MPVTSGGCSLYRNLDLDETGINVKASAGQVYGYHIFNAAITARYVKLYNKASAPTVGTDTPIITLHLAAGGDRDYSTDIGIPFSAGIGVGATTGVADNDTGAPSANDVIINLYYK